MSRIAGEVSQMLSLKTNMERQSGSIEALRTELGNQLHNTTWEGRAATQFRADWADYERVLVRMREALSAASREVGSRAHRLSDADS